MRIACWIPNGTNTRSEFIMLTAFFTATGYANALQCYVIRTLDCLVQISCWLLVSDTQHTNNCVTTRCNVREPRMLPHCVFVLIMILIINSVHYSEKNLSAGLCDGDTLCLL